MREERRLVWYQNLKNELNFFFAGDGKLRSLQGLRWRREILDEPGMTFVSSWLVKGSALGFAALRSGAKNLVQASPAATTCY